MRSLCHIILGAVVALCSLSLPWLLSIVVITQAATAKAQYDLYHADADTELHLSDIILVLLSGFVALTITRVML